MTCARPSSSIGPFRWSTAVTLAAILHLAGGGAAAAQEAEGEAVPAEAATAAAEKAAPAGATPVAAGKAGPAEGSPPAEESHRELAGHLFLPSHLIVDPFSCTAFGANFALGAGNVLAPRVDLSTSPPTVLAGTKWYGYTTLAQQFQLDVRFLEYLSARASVIAGAYLGTGREAVLVVGTGLRLGGILGLKASLPIGEHVRLALSSNAQYGPVYNVLLLQGIRDAIANGSFDQGFLQESDTITWVEGFSGAWAPWPFVGLTVNVDYLNPRKTGAASYSQNGMRAAAMADFDARPLLEWLPVGLNVAYAIIGPVGSGGLTTTQDFGFGAYYTGSRDLALGVEVDWESGTLEISHAATSTLAWINFRRYW